MNWLHWFNPFNYLAGRIFVWFWLVLLTAVFTTLLISRGLEEPTEIRRLPPNVIQQIRTVAEPLKEAQNIPELLNTLRNTKDKRWLLVNSTTNEVLNPELLPKGFDLNWLTELSQLNRPRALRHKNTFLAGPITLTIGDEQVALYQQRQRPPQPWWRLGELPEHFLLLFTVLISAAASFILAISISRPLRELLHQNLQFADGKLDSRISKLTRRRDELGLLGHSFNTMAERISALLTNQQRLLRDISHELRSPLARAHLALGLTERQQNLEQLPRLKQELERLDAMLDELLTYSKLDAGQYTLNLQTFDLSELLSEVLAVNQVEADAKQQQLILTAPDYCQISADSRLLARAIENILRNAIKYGPPNSTIQCDLTVNGQQAILKICDQGPGIPAAQLDAIFEPFYRISDSRNNKTGGTGLGLAIVAQVIRQHQGTVQASNEKAGGLCIELRLPLH
ncbi:ATP-binding protein [Chromatiaceae bacterium AAb-1]|nr:ATP-binding protein [Chromatiaceae bacterium AAb-1]